MKIGPLADWYLVLDEEGVQQDDAESITHHCRIWISSDRCIDSTSIQYGKGCRSDCNIFRARDGDRYVIVDASRQTQKSSVSFVSHTWDCRVHIGDTSTDSCYVDVYESSRRVRCAMHDAYFRIRRDAASVGIRQAKAAAITTSADAAM